MNTITSKNNAVDEIQPPLFFPNQTFVFLVYIPQRATYKTASHKRADTKELVPQNS